MKVEESFAQYLLSQKVISEEQLLSALVQLVKITPSLGEIAYEEKIFSTSILLKVLLLQSSKSLGFVDACKDLAIWSKEVEEKIFSSYSKRNLSLFEVLLKMVPLTTGDLNMYLDGYLSLSAQPPKTGDSLDTNTSDQKLPIALLAEFAEQFSQKTKEKIQSLLIECKSNSENRAELRGLFHRLLGASKFCSLKLHEEGFLWLESATEDPAGPPEFVDSASQVIEILWNLRSKLVEIGSVSSFSEIEVTKLKNIITPKSKLSEASGA